LFITTARGRNHAKSMLDMAQTRDDWFSEVLPVNVTNAMSEAAVEQQRLEYTGIFGKEAADALIDQEYYCSFEAAILGAYWVPHDAKMREVGAPGARTRIETLALLGRKPELVPDETLMDGINAGRKTIPFARFDKKRTAQGVECLRSYRTEWDEKARAFKLTPAHNWALHGSDAWRYLSLSWRAPMREPEEEKPIGIPLSDLSFDQFMDIEDSEDRIDKKRRV
jgi:hypothetical protein